MDERALEAYLKQHIPLARAMRVGVRAVSAESVELLLPLVPNLNHRDSAFGASIAAAAILAAWSLVSLRLMQARLPARLVIQRHTLEYQRPITADFSARAQLAAPASWDPFVRTLERRGRARIGVACTLGEDGQSAARFTGAFVALRSEANSAPI